MHDHSFHILLILLQVAFLLLVVLRKRFAFSWANVLITLALIVQVLPLAPHLYHHQSTSTSTHVCCIPTVSTYTPLFVITFKDIKFVFEREKEIFLPPFLALDEKSVRAPPHTTL